MPPETDDQPIADDTPDFLAESLAALDTPDTTSDTGDGDLDFLSTIAGELDEAKPKAEAKPDAKPKADEKPKATDKPAEDGDFPDEPPGKASDTAKAGWKELKSELKTIRETLAKKDAEIAEIKSKTANIAELEEKAKFADDAEKELAIARIESTREYKKVVTDPLNAIGEAAAELAKSYEIEADDLLDALSEPNPAKRAKSLETLLAGVSEQDKFEVYQMVKDTQTVLRKDAELKTRALEGRKELDSRQKEEQENQTKEQRKKYEAALDRTTQTLKEKLPFKALTDGETVDGVFEVLKNKALASNLSAATPDVQAFSAFAGIALPRLIKQYYAESERANAAEARVAELTAAGPTSKPSSDSKTSSPTGDDFLTSTLLAIGGH